MSQGIFVVIEGIDGSGKTTVAKALVERINKVSSAVYEREPTESEIGLLARRGVTQIPTMDGKSLALLFAADRIEHCRKIERMFAAGVKVVVCDRYVQSTLAYQDVQPEWALLVNRYALKPTLAFYLRVPLAVALSRIEHRLDTEPDAGLITIAYEAYEKMATGPTGMTAVDATRDVEYVVNDIFQRIADHVRMGV